MPKFVKISLYITYIYTYVLYVYIHTYVGLTALVLIELHEYPILTLNDGISLDGNFRWMEEKVERREAGNEYFGGSKMNILPDRPIDETRNRMESQYFQRQGNVWPVRRVYKMASQKWRPKNGVLKMTS